MTRRLLQWMGVLFVLGLTAAATAALLMVEDRVRIVVQNDEAAPGPDPIALLRDDVQVLQRDCADLRSALGPQFERLGSALEERAEARHREVRDVARTVGTLAKGQDDARAELQRLAGRLEAVERSLARVAEAPAAPTVEPDAVPVAEPVAAPTPAVAEPPAAQEAAPKKTGFLSFSVAPVKFQFDQLQAYTLVPELCRVGFDAKSTLHDFTGVTSKVKGHFTADFDDPRGEFRGEIECEAKTLTTGLEGRDTNLVEHLDAAHHAAIRFVVGAFEPGAVDVGKQTAEGTITGQMTIRGVARDVRMPIRITVDPSRRVVIDGQMPLKLTDYQIPVPSQLGGAITMQDEVSVWIALRARVQQGEPK